MANFDDLFTTPAAPESPSAPPQLTKEEYAAKKKAERDDLYALADEMAEKKILRQWHMYEIVAVVY